MTLPAIASAGLAPPTSSTAITGVDAGANPASASGGFGAFLGRALQGLVGAGHQADAATREALLGRGNLTDVVNAVTEADLALQTTTTIRDRMVQAYQDIIKMPI